MDVSIEWDLVWERGTDPGVLLLRCASLARLEATVD